MLLGGVACVAIVVVVLFAPRVVQTPAMPLSPPPTFSFDPLGPWGSALYYSIPLVLLPASDDCVRCWLHTSGIRGIQILPPTGALRP